MLQARERRGLRFHRQAAPSCLSVCQKPFLFLSALGQAAAAAQPLLPIADAAMDLLPGNPRLLLPKSVELTPARCPILCGAQSSKEQRARKSVDRCFRNKTAACS